MADLQSIIAGTDPTSALQLQALQAQNMASIAQDPSKWRDLGWGGALAHMLAGATAGPAAVGDVAQIAEQKQGAAPSLLQALASPNPWQQLYNNPEASPIAQAELAYSPGLAEAPAQTRALTAESGLRQAMTARQLWEIQNLQRLSGSLSSSPGSPGSPASALPSTPAVFPPSYGGRYPRPVTAASALMGNQPPPIAAPFAASPPPIAPFFGR
ncbi:MAG TPA: hypothetical protein VGF07_13110 [Stellaceae bacterium]|jgi:hypothetical protein